MSEKMTLMCAYKIIKPFLYIRNDPPGPVTEDVRNAGKFIIETEQHLPGFLSEKFCIAICCELDFEIQREAAWFLVSDMLNGTFVWITRLSNYSVEKALHQAGIIPANYCTPAEIRMDRVEFHYSDILKRIIEKFNLPTHRLHSDKILTREEKEERIRFNIRYAGNYGTHWAL